MHHACHFPRQSLLRLAFLRRDLHGGFQFRDFALVEQRKKLEIFHDIAVVGVDPELVEPVRRGELRVKPDRPGLGLAKFDARRRCHQGGNHSIASRFAQLAQQFNPHNDIAPLIAAAQLQGAVIAVIQHHKVVGLQQHIAELSKGNAVALLVTPPHRFLSQHIVDGKMLANIAQKIDHADGP